jgi:hypothetical protein
LKLSQKGNREKEKLISDLSKTIESLEKKVRTYKLKKIIIKDLFCLFILTLSSKEQKINQKIAEIDKLNRALKSDIKDLVENQNQISEKYKSEYDRIEENFVRYRHEVNMLSLIAFYRL